jgi:D-glycero-D-manno-heptose 1,7-bisphosphate phosphatase
MNSGPVSNMTRAVFLDRDGTVMEEVHYCKDPEKVRIYPGVPEALRLLKQAGFLLFIVTNQSGIARGIITEAQYHAVHAELIRKLGEGLIDRSYYCADLPSAVSSRRKPEPGMVLEAAEEFKIDLSRSFFIGDKRSDIECGRRAGTQTIQVMTGYGLEQKCAADFTADDLPHAVQIVLVH